MYGVQPISHRYAPQDGCAPSGRRVLMVTGEGIVSVEPDRALITVGVLTENQDLSRSQRENAHIITNVIRSLTELGIPRENIQTVEYRIQAQYDYVDGKPILRGYQTTHLLQITNEQITQTGRIVDTAVANGATTVSSIQFTLAHPAFFYNQALERALKNSQQKAATIARSLGVPLHVIPIKLTETTRTPAPPSPIVFSERSAATPIEPGMLQIQASVSAQYVY